RADVERLDGQTGVADPRVAVIPVALAADRLRQRGGRGGDDRAGGTIGEALQHPRAEAHELAMGTLVDVVLLLPRAPPRDRVGKALGDPLRVERLGRGRVWRDPLQREADLLAGADG